MRKQIRLHGSKDLRRKRKKVVHDGKILTGAKQRRNTLKGAEFGDGGRNTDEDV